MESSDFKSLINLIQIDRRVQYVFIILVIKVLTCSLSLGLVFIIHQFFFNHKHQFLVIYDTDTLPGCEYEVEIYYNNEFGIILLQSKVDYSFDGVIN